MALERVAVDGTDPFADPLSGLLGGVTVPTSTVPQKPPRPNEIISNFAESAPAVSSKALPPLTASSVDPVTEPQVAAATAKKSPTLDKSSLFGDDEENMPLAVSTAVMDKSEKSSLFGNDGPSGGLFDDPEASTSKPSNAPKKSLAPPPPVPPAPASVTPATVTPPAVSSSSTSSLSDLAQIDYSKVTLKDKSKKKLGNEVKPNEGVQSRGIGYDDIDLSQKLSSNPVSGDEKSVWEAVSSTGDADLDKGSLFTATSTASEEESAAIASGSGTRSTLLNTDTKESNKTNLQSKSLIDNGNEDDEDDADNADSGDATTLKTSNLARFAEDVNNSSNEDDALFLNPSTTGEKVGEKKVLELVNPAEKQLAALKEASSLLNDDADDLLGDLGGDLLSELDAITSSTTVPAGGSVKKKALPPVPPPPSSQMGTTATKTSSTTANDDLFGMLGDGGSDMTGKEMGADFDFDSYISNADASSSGGLFS